MKKTAYAVAVFIAILILAGYSAKSNADDDQYFSLGIGQSIINSQLKTGEVAYHVNDWEFQATLQESGETKRGVQDQVDNYSVSYVTTPKWGYAGIDPYFRLGLSYNNDSPMVGNTNFRLGIGVNFNQVWRVEYSHHSSAGIHNPNTGIDYITINYLFDPFWE